MRELPKGWYKCLIGDIAEVVGGGTPHASEPMNFSFTEGVPWITPADLSDHKEIYISRGKRFLSNTGFKNSSAKILPKDTILFSSRAPIGYVAIAANDIATNQGFKSFVCFDGIWPNYIYYYLKFAKKLAEELASGTTFPEISGTNAKKIAVPLAPFSEQRRIADKLELILSKVDACQQRLAKIPILLKRFRQSVLAAACSGRLTADWRKSDGHLDELPAGWKSVCVGDVIEDLKYGTAKKCTSEKRGVPVLRIPNLVNGKIDHTDLKFADLPPKEFKQLRLHSGDILIIRSNGSVSLVGKSALVKESEEGFAYAGYLIRLRSSPSVVESEFLNLVLKSHDIRVQVELKARSTSGVHNINGDEIRALKFLYPSLTEQQEIARRVRLFFAFIDKVESRFNKAKAAIDTLTQSLLAKAFRGELVPQDPEDEPASTLLERIRREKAQSETSQPRRKRGPAQPPKSHREKRRNPNHLPAGKGWGHQKLHLGTPRNKD